MKSEMQHATMRVIVLLENDVNEGIKELNVWCLGTICRNGDCENS